VDGEALGEVTFRRVLYSLVFSSMDQTKSFWSTVCISVAVFIVLDIHVGLAPVLKYKVGWLRRSTRGTSSRLQAARTSRALE
jgi:hypothetical protein